jgi:hypothetical protein
MQFYAENYNQRDFCEDASASQAGVCSAALIPTAVKGTAFCPYSKKVSDSFTGDDDWLDAYNLQVRLSLILIAERSCEDLMC